MEGQGEQAIEVRKKEHDIVKLAGLIGSLDKQQAGNFVEGVRVLIELEEARSGMAIRQEEALATGELRRWTAKFVLVMLGLTTLVSFSFLLLHSLKVIELPPQAVQMVSYSIPAEVLTLVGLVVKYLFVGRGRSAKATKKGGRKKGQDHHGGRGRDVEREKTA